ncbi:hypothetical protein HCN44_011223 [Aphidius gifuensis]|uniref:Tetratricopeptide repeat protein 1 n=1 Tax=Aphidius gifuensis TaxID=684658 RepID=A0A834XZC8_APHGI|nr:tetratricopeptide repeat protein 1 [Aphidius gifuensis]KAF7993954.1 hypothetical protein HCN44_011223 [Aphidius gifuensis]
MEEEKLKIPSNEEIIEEITRDLEGTCVKDEKQIIEDQDDKFYDVHDNLNEFDKHDDENLEYFDSVDEQKPELNHDNVDEEALKDRELNLSDDDKEKLRTEAEKLKNEGNNLFKLLNYDKAIETYTQGIQTCPLAFDNDRAILYANRAAAKSKCDKKTSAIDDCSKAIELNPKYLKAMLRRAQLYEQDDKLDEALADYQKVLEIDSSNWDALDATRRLPPKIQERNEKLKVEMMGKLKDLGNMILKPFGLSTNNFQMDQDPATGGYSVKFNQNNS